MSEELKPCPFCGASAEIDFGSVVDNPNSWQNGWVECANPACSAEIYINFNPDDDFDAELFLAEKWNSRRLTPKQQCADEMYEKLELLSSMLTDINAHGIVNDIEQLLAKARGEA